jgi:hypothetical protein
MKYLFKNRYNETIKFESVTGFNKFVIIEKTGKSLKTIKVSKIDGLQFMKLGFTNNDEIFSLDFSGGPFLHLGSDMSFVNFEGKIHKIFFLEKGLFLILI